jgi:hypothetical protein
MVDSKVALMAWTMVEWRVEWMVDLMVALMA